MVRSTLTHACHEPRAARALVPLEREGLDLTAGCLAESPTRSPDFGLDPEQLGLVFNRIGDAADKGLRTYLA